MIFLMYEIWHMKRITQQMPGVMSTTEFRLSQLRFRKRLKNNTVLYPPDPHKVVVVVVNFT